MSSVFPFLKNWEKFINDPFILELVKGYQNLFVSEPSQTGSSTSISMSQEETAIVDQKIQEISKKYSIKLVQPNTKNRFLSWMFVVPKRGSGHRPAIKLQKSNKHIPNIHFKMESHFVLKVALLKRDYMCKIALKDAYFSKSLYPKSQIFVSLRWHLWVFTGFLGWGVDIGTGQGTIPFTFFRI